MQYRQETIIHFTRRLPAAKSRTSCPESVIPNVRRNLRNTKSVLASSKFLTPTWPESKARSCVVACECKSGFICARSRRELLNPTSFRPTCFRIGPTTCGLSFCIAGKRTCKKCRPMMPCLVHGLRSRNSMQRTLLILRRRANNFSKSWHRKTGMRRIYTGFRPTHRNGIHACLRR